VEFDRKGAASAWERAVALAPNDGNVRAMRAVFHYCYVMGDTDTAVRELRLALTRDPLSHILHAHLGLVLSFGGRVDDAIVEAAKAMELDPQALYGHWIATMVRLDARHFPEAIDIASKAVARFGRHTWLLMGLTVAHARLSHLDAATAIYDELLARSRTEYVQSGMLAIMAMAIGRRDEAVARWSLAVDERDPMMVPLMLRTPLAAPLREQPEHRALLARLGWDQPLA
jgi:tetratricopeptide (TPR) repeat protein